jgi:acetyl esterase/lipase
MKFILSLFFLITSLAQAVEPLPPVLLYPNGASDARGTEDKDIPILTAYLPKNSTAPTTAILVCPGGGYGSLAGHEGAGYATWLAENGIAAVVLKYRLGTAGYRYPTMINDAARGMRLLRSKAQEWNIDPKRCGVMGSSAGGHLASTLLTHYDTGKAGDQDPIRQQSCRPDFGILCYAVITMGENTHAGSRKNLLGDNPSPEFIELLSNEKRVTTDTPPCFIWHTADDPVVKVENSLDFAAALRKAGVPFDLHIYQKGPHGIGLSIGKNGAAPGEVHSWAKNLLVWLRINGWAKRNCSARKII